MEELASVSWFLEQAKRQFQVLDIANIDRVEQKLPERKKRLLNPKTSNGAKRKRPRESLAVLIYQAMRHHQRKLTVAEISDFISDKYTYYKLRKHWTITGTIRNALCKDVRFRKIGRTQKENKRGCFWVLNCEPLWERILNGNAPLINSESEFRVLLEKFSDYQTDSSPSNSADSLEQFYAPVDESAWLEADNVDCLEFEDFEQFVKELDDKHPWQEDKNEFFPSEWNEWIF